MQGRLGNDQIDYLPKRRNIFLDKRMNIVNIWKHLFYDKKLNIEKN